MLLFLSDTDIFAVASEIKSLLVSCCCVCCASRVFCSSINLHTDSLLADKTINSWSITSVLRCSSNFLFFSCCSFSRSEEHTSELQSRPHLVCRLLLEKKKKE